MRIMRVATVNTPKSGGREAALELAMNLLDTAAEADPDIIVLPEACFNTRSSPEPVPGPLSELFGRKAREVGSYVILPMIRQGCEGEIYNVALLIDPQGRVVGEYQKHYFPKGLDGGMRPGAETPVFETPFGRIGMAICFDVHYPDVIRGLVAGGAEVVFFLTAFEGGRLLQSWALQHGVYVVSAHRSGYGLFIDKSGHLLQRGDPGFQRVIVRDLNMEREVFHLNYNWSKVQRIVSRYKRAVHVEVYRPEAFFVLETRSPDLTIRHLIEEYELETFRQYMLRCRKERERRLQALEAKARGGDA